MTTEERLLLRRRHFDARDASPVAQRELQELDRRRGGGRVAPQECPGVMAGLGEKNVSFKCHASAHTPHHDQLLPARGIPR